MSLFDELSGLAVALGQGDAPMTISSTIVEVQGLFVPLYVASVDAGDRVNVVAVAPKSVVKPAPPAQAVAAPVPEPAPEPAAPTA